MRTCLRSIISQLQDKNGAAGKNSTGVHLLRTQRENKQRRNLFVPAQQQSKLQQRQKRIPKKLPYTRREITNEDLFIYFLVLAKCPSHSARRESKSSSWSTKSRSKLEEHSGSIKIRFRPNPQRNSNNNNSNTRTKIDLMILSLHKKFKSK